MNEYPLGVTLEWYGTTVNLHIIPPYWYPLTVIYSENLPCPTVRPVTVQRSTFVDPQLTSVYIPAPPIFPLHLFSFFHVS